MVKIGIKLQNWGWSWNLLLLTTLYLAPQPLYKQGIWKFLYLMTWYALAYYLFVRVTCKISVCLCSVWWIAAERCSPTPDDVLQLLILLSKLNIFTITLGWLPQISFCNSRRVFKWYWYYSQFPINLFELYWLQHWPVA